MAVFSETGLWALLQVILVNLVLSGDNAVAIGMAAAGLPGPQRNKAILVGIVAATVLRLGFAVIAAQMLEMTGLPFLGGLLLLWVCWKMWKDLRGEAEASELAVVGVGSSDASIANSRPAKTLGQATLQIIVADVSMSLDNVLAVAGAAREHPAILVFGLLLSIVLMAVAASLISSLLNRYRWIGYVGLVVILYVAFQLIWQGAIEGIPLIQTALT
ncbi:MAG: TerC family protein [Hyphomicrobiales bacterium]|nr:TerC family protein [Hyphomicrobiales bacterium]